MRAPEHTAAAPPRAVEGGYLVIALVIGGLMVFLSPPFQSPDEPNHFFRALDVSRGHVLATRRADEVGALVDSGTVDWMLAVKGDIPFHPEHKQSLAALASRIDGAGPPGSPLFVSYPNTALYSPICYLPQAAGLSLGRRLGLPLLFQFYLARMLNLCASVLICWWGLRRLPHGVLPAALLLLSPVSLFQHASLSADALTVALAIAFCARVLELARCGMPAGRFDILGLALLGALVCLTKPSSAPLALLALLLPWSRAGGRRGWLHAVVVIAVSWGALLLWTLAVSGLYVPGRPGSIDPSAQLRHVLGHPLQFVITLADSLHTYWLAYVVSAVGVLGWLDTMLDFRYITWFYAVVVLAGLVAWPPRHHPSWQVRALSITVLAASYILTSVMMYMSWSDVGATLVEGIQGRYFLPLSVLWAVTLQWPAALQRRLDPRLGLALAAGGLIYAVVFLGHALSAMVQRYWTP